MGTYSQVTLTPRLDFMGTARRHSLPDPARGGPSRAAARQEGGGMVGWWVGWWQVGGSAKGRTALGGCGTAFLKNRQLEREAGAAAGSSSREQQPVAAASSSSR